MERNGHPWPYTEGAEEGLPEFRCESGVLVGNDIGWYAIQFPYLSGKYFRKIFALLFFFLRGIKGAILVNLSMITQSWSQPSVKGRSVIKSMAIDCHGK
jgi:hypothetical protein